MIGWGSDVNTAHRPAYVRDKGRCERGRREGGERCVRVRERGGLCVLGGGWMVEGVGGGLCVCVSEEGSERRK
jgi:hypothetical protein